MLAAITLAYGSAFFGLWLTYRRDVMRASALAWLSLGAYSALSGAMLLQASPPFGLSPALFRPLPYVTAVIGSFTAMAIVGVAYAVVAPTKPRRVLGRIAVVLSLMLCGTLCGVEMGLAAAGVPHRKNGVGEALEWLRTTAAESGTTAQRRAA